MAVSRETHFLGTLESITRRGEGAAARAVPFFEESLSKLYFLSLIHLQPFFSCLLPSLYSCLFCKEGCPLLPATSFREVEMQQIFL